MKVTKIENGRYRVKNYGDCKVGEQLFGQLEKNEKVNYYKVLKIEGKYMTIVQNTLLTEAEKESLKPAPIIFKVGDIIINRAGYGSLTCKFYQIVSRTAKTVKTKVLKTTNTHEQESEFLPIPNNFENETETRWMIKENSLKSKRKFANLWDGVTLGQNLND